MRRHETGIGVKHRGYRFNQRPFALVELLQRNNDHPLRPVRTECPRPKGAELLEMRIVSERLPYTIAIAVDGAPHKKYSKNIRDGWSPKVNGLASAKSRFATAAFHVPPACVRPDGLKPSMATDQAKVRATLFHRAAVQVGLD